MTEDQPRKLAAWKRLLGMLALVAIVLVSAMGGYLLVNPGGPPAPSPDQVEPPLLLSTLFWLVLGCVFFGAGVFGYVVVVVTHALTFDFSKPVWRAQKLKIWVFHIAVMVPAALGLGSFGIAVFGPVLSALGLPAPFPDMVPLIVALVLVQVGMVFFNIWAPMAKSSVRRRLASYGVTERDLDGGWLVGISDPAKSSFKKLTFVEEDVGMLWFRGDQLVYRGDAEGFEVRRDDLLDVERASDAGNVQALGGAVHVILRFRNEDGAERRVRLHPLGCWHAGAVNVALEALAARLKAWRQPLPPVEAASAPAPP